MADIDVNVLIRAKDQASGVLKKFGNTASTTGNGIKDKLTDNVTSLGAAFAVTSGIVLTSIKAFTDSQNSAAQLNAVLASTKGIAGVTADEVLKLSAALQQQSKFSDEAITDAQSLLLTFTGIGKEVFPDATQAVLNMSTALGQDLKSSSIQLGKALQDPILGVTALRRVGVNFNEQQQEMIKTMVESGRILEAQKFILHELSTEFGGSALASSKTFDGQMVILMNNINDLQETIGEGLIDSLVELGGGFDNVNIKVVEINDFLKKNKDVVMALSAAILVVTATIGILFVAALLVMAGTVGIVIAAVGGLIAILVFLAVIVKRQWEGIKAVVGANVDVIIFKITELKNHILSEFNSIKEGVVGHINALRDRVNGILAMSAEDWGFFFGELVGKALTAYRRLEELDTGLRITAQENARTLAREIPPLYVSWLSSIGVAFNIKTTEWNNALMSKLNTWKISIPSIFAFIRGRVISDIEGMKLSFLSNVKEIEKAISNISNAIKGAQAKLSDFGSGFSKGLARRQAGGPVKAGSPYVVGEAGAELFVPHQSGNIVPNNLLGSRGSSAQVNLSVNVGVYAGTQTEKRNIAKELYDGLVQLANSQNKTVAELLGG